MLGDPPVVFCDSDRLNFVKRTKDIFDVPGLRVERVGTDGPGIKPYPPLSHRVVVLIVPNTIKRADGKANVLCDAVTVMGGGEGKEKVGKFRMLSAILLMRHCLQLP